MRNGPELVLQLALLQKPAAFSIQLEGSTPAAELVVNALNAVRLFGHSQILAEGSVPVGWHNGGDDDRNVAKICEMITAMQLEGEKIEITTTPEETEEDKRDHAGIEEGTRERVGFCRIDLRLKK